jgi:hypothetical protein
MRDHYKGRDIFLLGSGPSLLIDDFIRREDETWTIDRLKGKVVIAINHMHRYCSPDMLVFLDSIFRAEEVKRGVQFDTLPFKVVTGPSSGLSKGGNISTFHYAAKPEMNGSKFYGMANSALFALNVALYCGASRVFLLGIDCCFHNGRSHFYSDYQKHVRDKQPEPYEKTARQFEYFSNYKNVFNLSPISRIKCFEKKPIGEIL